MFMSEKSALPFAKSFRELIVYQRQRELARQVFEVSQKFPREEQYALTDQLRRASRSIGAQIAEAWAKRDYERHFVSKLTDADAEQQEAQHWIETAADCRYLNETQRETLLSLCSEIGRMLHSMRARAKDFCPNSLRLQEDSPSDFAPQEKLSTEH
jgi:four helix bundle protein